MQTREKYLAGGLGSIIALWFLLPWYDATFVQPIREAEGTLKGLQSELSAKDDKELELIKATGRLKNWRDQSLPPDPLVAHRVYSQWLTEIAQATGWTDLKVKLDGKNIRGNAYTTIPVTLTGQATREQLANFLARFEEVALLQRVSRLVIESPQPEGEPRLLVTLTAEGLSVNGAANRNRLFPAVELKEPLTKEATQLRVEPPAVDFPETVPFRVRVDNEWLNVTAIDGDLWSVTRSIGGTHADHLAGTMIEWTPFQTEKNLESLATAWTSWTDLRPFLKPRPAIEYKPRLTIPTPEPVVIGKPWSLKSKLEGWNPADGEARWQIVGDVPAGLQLSAETGELSWTAVEGTKTETLPLEIAAVSPIDGKPRVTAKINVTVQLPNNPPKFKPLEFLAAYPGRELNVQLQVDDPDLPRDVLTYSLETSPYPGLTLDAQTGRLRWEVPPEQPLSEQTLTVTVKDQGPPSASDRLTVPLRVQDDPAVLIYLIASVTVDGEPEAWLRDRGSERKILIKAGQEISSAELLLRVTKIERDGVIFESSSGKYRLGLGQNLREMILIPTTAASDEPRS